MNKLVILILFSAFALTLVATAMIPDFMIPRYDDNLSPQKPKTPKINNVAENPGYQIETITENLCAIDSDCATPEEYLLMSRCPFASKCVDGKCAVICPEF